MLTGPETAPETGISMVWELVVICVTIYLLFSGYMKEKARELEIENDRRDDENLHRNNDI